VLGASALVSVDSALERSGALSTISGMDVASQPELS